MNVHDTHVIGIVGGMGPQAGAVLFNNILALTKATSDQEHLSAILMSFPKDIVDRTAFLEGHEQVNPALKIAEVIRKLEAAGATVIGIACNTSYTPAIYNVVLHELEQTNSRIQLLHMPLEVCRYIKEQLPFARRVGVMTTNGTYRSKVYTSLLQHAGYDAIVPDYTFQHEVIHKMIYDPAFGLKSVSQPVTQEAQRLLREALHFFSIQQCDAVILGCTEFSFALKESCMDGMAIIDSTSVMAAALIREATSHRKLNGQAKTLSKTNQ